MTFICVVIQSLNIHEQKKSLLTSSNHMPQTTIAGELDAQLRAASTPAHLRELLSNLDERSAALDSSMANFTATRLVHHQSVARSLELARVELAGTLGHARSLKSLTDRANALGVHITDRVRALDKEKASVAKLKAYVDDVGTLKVEMRRAAEAIASGDDMAAARAIGVIRSLPQETVKDSYADFKVPIADMDAAPSEVVEGWITDLEVRFVDGFSAASTAKDVKILTHYFQMFPLIGKSHVGLNLYSRFVCNVIGETSRGVLKTVRGNSSEIYAQVLFKLYKTVSALINQHQRLIRRYYGPEALLQILRDIQAECDLQSSLVLDTYADQRNLEELQTRVSKYDYPVLVQEITSQRREEEEGEVMPDLSVNLGEVNGATDEISAMMNHWGMYVKFYTVFWNGVLADLDTVGDSEKSTIYPYPLVLSSFHVKLTTLVQTFDALCTYSVRRTLENACTLESLADVVPPLSKAVTQLQTVFKRPDLPLDMLPCEEPPVSSLGDDLLGTLNTIIMEVLSTGELQSVKNMVSNIKRILVVDFTGIVQQKMNRLQLRPTSHLLTKTVLNEIQTQMTGFASPARVQSPVPGSTVSRVAGGANELASQGALFIKSLNNAIYTMADEHDAEGALASLSGASSSNPSDLHSYLTYLNTLVTFADSLDSLVNKCCEVTTVSGLVMVDEHELTAVREALEANPDTETKLEVTPQEQKVKNILQTIADSFRERAQAIVIGRTQILFDKVLRTKMEKLAKEALQENYVYGEEGRETSGAPVTRNNFVRSWTSLVVPYAYMLAPSVFHRLLAHAADVAAAALEERIWTYKGKISNAGALALETDLSLAIADLTRYDYSLRDKFIKVTQMVMILELEDDEELLELEAAGVEWALTPSERTKCRSMLLR